MQWNQYLAQRSVKQLIQQGFVIALVPLFTVVLMAGRGDDDLRMQDRSAMADDQDGGGGTFKHIMTMDGVKAEFQIIDLEKMNMKDANGITHHVTAKFFNADTGEQIKNGTGKIIVITPFNETSVASLRDYGGIYAANLKFIKPGKYKVTCHIKADEKNPMYNFEYNHQE